MNTKKHLMLKAVAIILIAACILPMNAMAAEPRASDYIYKYTGYIYPDNLGQMQIWFEVQGTGTMDEIGTTQIQLYESTDNQSWTWVKTFNYSDYPDMLRYDNHYHIDHVNYIGVIGRYYKAYICVWAGKNGGGDSRYFWTTPKQASIFAA